MASARRKAVKADPRYRRCLSSTCTSGQIHRKTTNPVVNCKMCGSLSYHMAWHEGYFCDRYGNSLVDRVFSAAICFSSSSPYMGEGFWLLSNQIPRQPPTSQIIAYIRREIQEYSKESALARDVGSTSRRTEGATTCPAVDAGMCLTGAWFNMRRALRSLSFSTAV